MVNIPERNSLSEEERLQSLYNDIPLMSAEDRKKFPKLKYQCIYGENEEIFENVERHVICSEFPHTSRSLFKYSGSQNIKKLLITCYIDSIKYLENLKEIEHDSLANFRECFAQDCHKLKKVVFKQKVKGIPNMAFLNCKSLEEIKFDEGLEGHIGSSAFERCAKLSNIVLDGITEIKREAFVGCTALKKAEMPNVKTIEKYAFSGCTELTEANMPSAIQVGENAFEGCKKLKKAEMPNVKTIEEYAFFKCEKLTEANMPSARQVENHAFEDCKKLKNITVNSSASFEYACFGDLNLEKITFIGNLSDENISDDFMEDTKVNEIKVTGKINDNVKEKILNQLHSDCQDKVKFGSAQRGNLCYNKKYEM